MKILWNSNGVHVPSGYGQQTGIFTALLAEGGHDVTVSANHGLAGHGMQLGDNLRMLPAGGADFGQEAVKIYHEQLKPDATVLLLDIWVMHPQTLLDVDAISWCPIDHLPAPPATIDRLRYCKQVWAMSRFGLRMLREAGITDAWYVPHGVRTDVFKPVDRAEARKKWEIPQDVFVAVCTAANNGYPSRKHLDKLIKAWGVFIRKHPDAVLVLHTDPRPAHGFDIYSMIRFYGIPDKNIHVPTLYALQTGAHEPKHLNELYNAGDVFILPSAGEGFGIPAIEAQAAGSPVILTDFSAQTELAGSGWLIDVDHMDYVYTLQGSEQAHVSAGQILKALEMAYEKRGDESLRVKAREFALQYDAKRVYETYMLPALRAATCGETAETRTAQRVALRTVDADPIAPTSCHCKDDGGVFCCAECAYTATVGMLETVEAL